MTFTLLTGSEQEEALAIAKQIVSLLIINSDPEPESSPPNNTIIVINDIDVNDINIIDDDNH